MSNYHIQKSRRHVVVEMHSGEMLAGDMFLQPYGRQDGGEERPIDILNAAEHFFPVCAESGEIVLLAKDQVLAVTCDRLERDDDPAPAITRRAGVEVRLINGETLSATVLLEVPEDHPRVLDFFNRWKSRFLSLDTANGQLLVNRSMIERVRSLD